MRRWAAELQNDFRVRLEWCVKPFKDANHAPVAVVNRDSTRKIVMLDAAAGSSVKLNADGSADPDGQALTYEWTVYPEAGTYQGKVVLDKAGDRQATLQVPADAGGKTIHLILAVRDAGTPPLTSWRRVVVPACTRPRRSAGWTFLTVGCVACAPAASVLAEGMSR